MRLKTDFLTNFFYFIYLIYKIIIRKNYKKYFSGEEKKFQEIIKDQFLWYRKEKSFNTMYFAFGLNLKKRKQENYIGKKEIAYYKRLVEKKLKDKFRNNLDYSAITKDKFYSGAILKANLLNNAENIALIKNNLIFEKNLIRNLDHIYNYNFPFVIKNITLEAGEGILICEIKNKSLYIDNKIISIDKLKLLLKEGIWVIQKRYRSHKKIRQINSTALNTTRIVTILNKDKPVYLAGFQAFATNQQQIDSWSKGSIYVGFDPEKNILKKIGYYNPWHKNGALAEIHPNSNIEFENYEIPFLKEAVDLCIKAHRIFYFNFIIGWDVAITDEGPIIIEANENPGMNAVQCVDGGIRYKVINYANTILREN